MIHIPELNVDFATAPRCGNHLVLHLLSERGISHVVSIGGIHQNYVPTDSKLKISMVRNPFNWLLSYYYVIQGAPLDCPADEFSSMAREASSGSDFLRLYLQHMPGAVGRMFASYGADIVWRLEDMPEAFDLYLTDVGRERLIKKRVNAEPAVVNPMNTKLAKLMLTSIVDRRLPQLVLEAESEFCERYEYEVDTCQRLI